VIRSVDAPLTEEEEAAQAAAEKEAAEKAARIKAEQEQKARRDRILTLTYGTVEEIELARDERISLLESYIQLNQKNLKQKEAELEAINKRIQPFVEKGNPVPEAFSSKQTRLSEEVATLNGNIEHQKQQLKDLEQRFASDIQRFEEIQEEKKKAKASAN
jgi:DNA repair exonuclease SbcCD ATPase subunit